MQHILQLMHASARSNYIVDNIAAESSKDKVLICVLLREAQKSGIELGNHWLHPTIAYLVEQLITYGTPISNIKL